MLNLNQLQRRFVDLTLGFCAALLTIPLSSVEADDILIDNSQLPTTGLVAAPLVTIRPVTTASGAVILSEIQFTKDLIVRSAISFPEVRERLEEEGITDLNAISMDDFVAVIRSSAYPDRYLYGASASPRSTAPYPPTKSIYAQEGLHVWDARTLTNMVVTGVVNTESVNMSTIGGKEVEWVKIDDEYVESLKEIYLTYWHLKGEGSPADVGVIFTGLRDDVMRYDALQRSILENIGEITFGVPVTYTATEKGLAVPLSIRKRYDVYWADLVVTYRDIDIGDLVEMVFNVAVPEGSVALKLIPLRFGIEVSQSRRIGTPEVGVKYQGAQISVGEYFSQTVAYKFLKPTVEAYGEGERRFSWKMTGEAIGGGSHRFATIIGVPKGAPQVDFAFSGHVRLRKSFIGEWYDGELVAGTDFWVVPVSF